jgi:hypothetical protein
MEVGLGIVTLNLPPQPFTLMWWLMSCRLLLPLFHWDPPWGSRATSTVRTQEPKAQMASLLCRVPSQGPAEQSSQPSFPCVLLWAPNQPWVSGVATHEPWVG